jgi:hypothetical protein
MSTVTDTIDDMTDIEYARRTITMPAATAAAVAEKVGKGGFSAYVTEVVEERLRREAMEEALAESVAKHGPVDEEEVWELIRKYCLS